MTVYVTPAQRDLARLDLELAERLTEPADPHMLSIAHAEPLDPTPTRESAGEIAGAFMKALEETRMWRFQTNLESVAVEVAQGPSSDFWLHIAGLRTTDHRRTRDFATTLAHQLADLAAGAVSDETRQAHNSGSRDTPVVSNYPHSTAEDVR